MSDVHHRPVCILLVEDDEDDYIITRDLLRDIFVDRFSLEWASNTATASALLKEDRHDVCLMDNRLDEKNGVQLLKEASEIGFTGPIIMLTGQEDDDLDSIAMQSGAVDYLIKNQLTAAALSKAIRYSLARRNAERERFDRLKAEAENKSKTMFMAHLSHELRTPLTAILGFTDLLIEKAELAGRPESALHIIKRNGRYLLDLLNDVLDLSKVETGKLDLDVRRFSFINLLSEVRNLMSVNASEKGLRFVFKFESPVPEYIESDEIRLRQILLNLISNAIKYTLTGSVTVCVALIEKSEGDQLEVQVEDTGKGIKDKEQRRLFEPFYQASNQSDEEQYGAGLGLAISQKLANCLEGNITVESQQNKGSLFTLKLKAGNVSGRRFETLRNETPMSALPVHCPALSGWVLIAEDQSDIRTLVGQRVEATGVEVCYARNGKETLDLLAQHDASNRGGLVIMDLNMPVMGGIEAISKIRQRYNEIPVIALTAAALKGERERCITAGFDYYLSKPVNFVELMRILECHLPAMNSKPKDSSQALTSTTIKLLLVEDDADARSATEQLMNMLGADVVAVASAGEALTIVKKQMFDLILLDYHLPDLDGLSLAAKIKSIYNGQSKCYLLSGRAMDNDLLNGRSLRDSGILKCLLKPLDIEALKTILTK